MALTFFSLPLECRSHVYSCLTQNQQFGFFSTNKTIYTENKLKFLKELFENLLQSGTINWLPDRKNYAIKISHEKSYDKLQPIRNGILALFSEWSASSITSEEPNNYPYCRDEILLRNLILASCNTDKFMFFYDHYKKSWRETYLTLVSEGSLHPTALHLELRIPWDDKTLVQVAYIIENQGIQKVTLVFKSWTPSQFITVVKAIKNSHIIQATLVDIEAEFTTQDDQQAFSQDMLNEVKRIADCKFNIKIGRFYLNFALILKRKLLLDKRQEDIPQISYSLGILQIVPIAILYILLSSDRLG